MDTTILAKVRTHTKLCLRGPFGTGKSSLAIERARWLLAEGTRGDDLLVLVPHPVNAVPFELAFSAPDSPGGAPARVRTPAQIARETVDLHWPVLAPAAGFRLPEREPVFLNVEGAQYYLGKLVNDALAAGAFEGAPLARGQVVLQTLTTMAHASFAGLALDDAYARLKASRPSAQGTIQFALLNEAQDVALQFRALCLDQGLVDFSLLMLLLRLQLDSGGVGSLLARPARHLVADNLEEDNAVGHALVQAWLPAVESALLCSDDDGGFRTTLGADPAGVELLAGLCDETIHLTRSHVASGPVAALAPHFERALGTGKQPRADAPPPGGLAALSILVDDAGHSHRFFPQMISAVAAEVARLVDSEGIPPRGIALIAPAIGDAMRFGLEQALSTHSIAATTHRPGRALADEPAVRALITLARLAHPQWGSQPAAVEVQQALLRSVQGLDPLRAALLVADAYSLRNPAEPLRAFDALPPAVRRRIPDGLAAAYEELRVWLAGYRAGAPLPLDLFLSRLFEEVLSSPDFTLRDDVDAVRAANQMVESARAMRRALEPLKGGEAQIDIGQEYLHLVQSGVLGALSVPAWELPEEAVLITTPAAFLLRNQAVEVQFWIDASSPAWDERFQQSLTNPAVLTGDWPAGQPWTDGDDTAARRLSLRRTLLGLLRRSRRAVVVAMSDYSENGHEQRGPLAAVIDTVLAHAGKRERRQE